MIFLNQNTTKKVEPIFEESITHELISPLSKEEIGKHAVASLSVSCDAWWFDSYH